VLVVRYWMASPSINRDLYRLILSQLVHDGFTSIAQTLSQASVVPIQADGVGNTLFTLLQSTLVKDRDNESISDVLKSAMKDDDYMKDEVDYKVKGLDLGMDIIDPVRTSALPNYTTKFITTHKSEVRIARFSPDGKWVATGSQDTSIKLLDVIKMKTYNETKQETTEDFAPSRPVIRTFYDHSEPINDIDFHPTHPILISASKDHTIRFYEFKSSQKRAFKCIQVRYGSEGNLFSSCSRDGAVKIWDAVTNSVVNTIPNAHAGAEVTSVMFTKNMKFLLTCGKDGCSKLWELSTGRPLIRYATTPMAPIGFGKHRLMSTFNHTEDFVLGSDELQLCGVVWDARTGEVVQRLTGHNNLVKWVATSPVDSSMMTCSNDHRARFWTDDNNK